MKTQIKQKIYDKHILHSFSFHEVLYISEVSSSLFHHKHMFRISPTKAIYIYSFFLEKWSGRI
jgi:hypothetical protein